MSSRVSTLGFGLLLFAAFAAPVAASDFEESVLAELNFARAQPREYARQMMREPVSHGQTGYADLREQDPDAFEEAIDFMMRQPPLPPLRHDPRLGAAAREHAASQGPRGDIGHVGPGGQTLGQRLQRHGVAAGLAAENISYGYGTPREVVLQLIVDSGVPDRGHRKNIFGRNYDVAGVACGRHRTYDSMCVIDFAGAMAKR